MSDEFVTSSGQPQLIPPVASTVGGITPIPFVLMVDPNTAAFVPDGAWSGDRSFPTLQAAYNSLPAHASAVIWCAPGAVGPLVMTPGDDRSLCIRAHGGQFSVPSSIGAITIANTCAAFELRDVITGAIAHEGGEGQFAGTARFDSVAIGGNLNIPGALLFSSGQMNFGGSLSVAGWLSDAGMQQPPTGVFTANGVVSLDSQSETQLQTQDSTMQTDTVVIRTGRYPSASAVVGPDADHTFLSDRRAVICSGAKLTLARTWTIQNGPSNTGFVVDIWRQTANLIIKDQSAATLYTYLSGGEAVRLFFFGAGGANYVLTGVELLEQSS